LEELDKDDAEYPRKITYHNPPNLALEALEVILLLHSVHWRLSFRIVNVERLFLGGIPFPQFSFKVVGQV
jgi:hypothetical protein